MANDNEDVSEPIKLDHEDGSEDTYGSGGVCGNVNWAKTRKTDKQTKAFWHTR